MLALSATDIDGDALDVPTGDGDALALSDDDNDGDAEIDGEVLVLPLALAIWETLVEPVTLPDAVTCRLPLAEPLPLTAALPVWLALTDELPVGLAATVLLPVRLPLTDAEMLVEAATDGVGVTLRPYVGLTDDEGGGELLTLGDVLVLPASDADDDTLAEPVGDCDALALSDDDGVRLAAAEADADGDGDSEALVVASTVLLTLLELEAVPITEADSVCERGTRDKYGGVDARACGVTRCRRASGWCIKPHSPKRPSPRQTPIRTRWSTRTESGSQYQARSHSEWMTPSH